MFFFPCRPGSRPNEAFERGLRVSGSQRASDNGQIKQRPCRCLRSITDESLVLIEMMIQLKCWGTEVLFTAPRASPRAGLGGNGPRQPSAGARVTQYSTVRTIQHTCKSSIVAHACGVLCCHSSHPRFTTSVAWSATSSSMVSADCLLAGSEAPLRICRGIIGGFPSVRACGDCMVELCSTSSTTLVFGGTEGFPDLPWVRECL